MSTFGELASGVRGVLRRANRGLDYGEMHSLVSMQMQPETLDRILAGEVLTGGIVFREGLYWHPAVLDEREVSAR